MIKQMRPVYPLPFLQKILNVSSSSYYAWLTRKPSKRAQEDVRLEIEIKAAHKRTKETCGPERLQKDMEEHGIKAGVCRIRRIRKKLNIRCKQVKKFKATTNSSHNLPVAENILEQNFKVTEPNKAWVSDITYIPTGEGWLYLAGHKDLCTGEVVGYAMSNRMNRALVCQSLFRAVVSKRPPNGLINHSDRGSQYCSLDYQKLIKQFGMKASMSRKGNCYDNAPIESFWGTLKQELVHHRNYRTRQEAIQDITEYIEVFYNRQRKQKRLGYLSPAVYEKKFYEKRLSA
jgi:transposase InsO family protein